MRGKPGAILNMQQGYLTAHGTDHGFEIGEGDLGSVRKIGGKKDMGLVALGRCLSRVVRLSSTGRWVV